MSREAGSRKIPDSAPRTERKISGAPRRSSFASTRNRQPPFFRHRYHQFRAGPRLSIHVIGEGRLSRKAVSRDGWNASRRNKKHAGPACSLSQTTSNALVCSKGDAVTAGSGLERLRTVGGKAISHQIAYPGRNNGRSTGQTVSLVCPGIIIGDIPKSRVP